ncbi:hypothetical protein [Janthinobacterium sp. ROICE36]|uniref:hypothetical protein n=1 Tax=Janthinobacterium sp. ROICE36 TaxID=2048670 RepID=UPI000C7F49B4|nr:hypothetical protein [Janthinobacterium sp. ROICE36]
MDFLKNEYFVKFYYKMVKKKHACMGQQQKYATDCGLSKPSRAISRISTCQHIAYITGAIAEKSTEKSASRRNL